MASFVWKDQIKVTVGELSRADQLDLWREITDRNLSDLEAVLQNERIGELIAVKATRAVEALQKTEVEFSPLTVEAFNRLPMSLANEWIKAAMVENGGLAAVLSFPSASVLSMDAGSEPQSDAS